MAAPLRHDPDLVELFSEPERAIRRIADQAIARGTLTEELAAELIELFGVPPGPNDSGLSAEEAQQFLCTTLQLIDVCLREESRPQKPLINALLNQCLDRECEKQGGRHWSLTREISDDSRRGRDRRFTFGQIKEKPSDPQAPSMFGGAWQANCDGTERRVTFLLTAEALTERTTWEPVTENEKLTTRVRSRGPYPWRLQVEPQSPLGEWIAGLTGTHNIGQHRGHFPLGVLCDAVQRHLAPLGFTHLLLGPSRRDPATRPWHTGGFLRRSQHDSTFNWQGHAFVDEGPIPVQASCVVRISARIASFL